MQNEEFINLLEKRNYWGTCDEEGCLDYRTGEMEKDCWGCAGVNENGDPIHDFTDEQWIIIHRAYRHPYIFQRKSVLAELLASGHMEFLEILADDVKKKKYSQKFPAY